ncbi:MAG: SPOR domain-containing protein [Gammaproteobacteria bacterium]
MPKDYKNINKGKKQPNPFMGNLLSFATGLTIGLFIAFLVFLEKIMVFENLELPAFLSADKNETVDTHKEKPDKESNVPAPTFDFYKILPDREINISEWVADEQPQEEALQEIPEDGVYILQVGSFREFESADRLKAELALLGIDPQIQRVVINGQDVRYRVRVGPYKNADRLDDTRQKLSENQLNFMLLKLKAEEH